MHDAEADVNMEGDQGGSSQIAERNEGIVEGDYGLAIEWQKSVGGIGSARRAGPVVHSLEGGDEGPATRVCL